MILEKLLVINYRSCRKIKIEFKAQQPNILIGVNDCGKSTILKAAELLFNDKAIFSFSKDNSARRDFSNSPLEINEFENFIAQEGLPSLEYNGNQCYVLGKLNIHDGELSEPILESLTTTARWIIESNDSNYIWITKCFDTTNNSIKSLVLLKDCKIKEERLSAFSLTSSQLTNKVKELEVPKEHLINKNNSGPLSSIEKVRAIYSFLGSSAYWSEFKFDKGDKEILPTFRYLDWNYSLEEIKGLAGDAMRELLEEHINPLKVQVTGTATRITDGINEKLKNIHKIIGQDFPNITAIKTKVFIDLKESITDIIINKSNADGDIHLDAQGEGVKRQIWFAMLKTAASVNSGNEKTLKKFIWAFDEPETHLYPTAQRQLFDLIQNISFGNVQTILSTHSTIFIDKIKLNTITGVMQNSIGYSELYGIDSIDSIYDNLNVRNSDFLFYNKFLIIEGDTEAHLIPGLYRLWKGNSHEEDNIQIINIKGKNGWLQVKQILESVFNGFKKDTNNVVFLFDNDFSYDLGQRAITSNMFFVGKQDIEDSIDSSIWVQICNEKLHDFGVTVTREDIEHIKSSIPTDRAGAKMDKFYIKLQTQIRNKLKENNIEDVDYDILNSKGSDSAKMILKYLVDSRHIDSNIISAFEKLNNN
ncbi:ATP-dependent endonuclease [Emticicia sp. TH156]|uniref:ATP-dependent nuclease n=1 Tax=Emticicia sp. TH156 TaxID=2067454 RepID=UPI000C7816EF|nr:AAA family ATPase [Emticicia sp. TH156]PLK44772.1 hypothetical protein C0V77_10015 [Emticicia sp. TH156]